MSAELLVNVAPFETRIAPNRKTDWPKKSTSNANANAACAENIYKGRVQRVLPGIQAAFVDIGLEKAGFFICRRRNRTGY